MTRDWFLIRTTSNHLVMRIVHRRKRLVHVLIIVFILCVINCCHRFHFNKTRYADASRDNDARDQSAIFNIKEHQTSVVLNQNALDNHLDALMLSSTSSPLDGWTSTAEPWQDNQAGTEAEDRKEEHSKLGRHIANNCRVHFARNHSLPAVALASSPGSGNTWVRFLLEQASGIYSGSAYNDKKLYAGGFYGEYDEYDSGRTLVVKTHERWESINRFSHGVLLMRNPYDACISEYNRKTTGQNHTGVVDWSADITNERKWIRTVQNRTRVWKDVATAWLEHYHHPIHVCYYEDLVSDPIGETERILQFLNITERRVDCLKSNLEGKFHRKSEVDRSLQYAAFNEKMRRKLDRAIESISIMLVLRGWKPIPRTELKYLNI